MRYIIVIIIIFVLLSGIPPHPVASAEGSMAQKLAGRILLQVESHGEAWYVSPDTLMRYYLGRPTDAFTVMREHGVGITDRNLDKIPVGLCGGPVQCISAGTDSDGDGLSDNLEIALGTDVNSADTDGDGHGDLMEVRDGYDPLGPGVMPVDLGFAAGKAGRIFLAVERHGEAWYVDISSYKRYFLGKPADAFSVMRSLGLGITDTDLDKIIARTPGYELPAIEARIYELVNRERTDRGHPALTINTELSAIAREHSYNLARENMAFTGLDVSCDFPLIHHEGLTFGPYNSDRLAARGIRYFSKTGENIALMPGASVKTLHQTIDEAYQRIKDCSVLRSGMDESYNSRLNAGEDTTEKIRIINEELRLRTEAFAEELPVTLAAVDWTTREELAEDTVQGWMDSPGHRRNILAEEYDETGIGAAYVNGYLIVTQVFLKRAVCGFEGGSCCVEEGYYPFCFTPLECRDAVCQ